MSAEGVNAARAAIPALVTWAANQRIDGVIVDYEPSKNYTADHVAAYASFLHELSVGKKRKNNSLLARFRRTKCSRAH